MPNPWDPLPFPAHGDDDPKLTLYGVGLFITSWEAIEFELSRLYSVFVGDPDGEAIREYGNGRIFRERISHLNTTAQNYFCSNPNQNTEGEFSLIVSTTIGYSTRRNEIAHGIVMNVANITLFRERMPLLDPHKMQTVVVPPYYAMRSHGNDGFPLYAYNTVQLEALSKQLLDLEASVRTLRKSLIP